MTMGARYEIELDGREYSAWEDVDGRIGAIKVEYEVWKRGERLGPEIKKVVQAMGIPRLMPRPHDPLPDRRWYPFPPPR